MANLRFDRRWLSLENGYLAVEALTFKVFSPRIHPLIGFSSYLGLCLHGIHTRILVPTARGPGTG